jgi:hypothetical protein
MPQRRPIVQAAAVLLELASLGLLLAGVAACFLAVADFGTHHLTSGLLIATAGLAAAALAAGAVRASCALERRAARPPPTARGFPVRPIHPQPVLPPERDDANGTPIRDSR